MTEMSDGCHEPERFATRQQKVNELVTTTENLTTQVSQRNLQCSPSGQLHMTSHDHIDALSSESFRSLFNLVRLPTEPMEEDTINQKQDPVCCHWRYTEHGWKRRRTFSYPTSSRPFRLFPLPQSVKRVCARCESNRTQASGVNFGDVSLAVTSRSNTLMSGLMDWVKVLLSRPSSQTLSFVEEQMSKSGQDPVNRVAPTELQRDSVLDTADKTKMHGSPFSWMPDMSSQMDVSFDFQVDCNEPTRSVLSSAADHSPAYRTVAEDSQHRFLGTETFYFTPRDQTQSIPWPSDSQMIQRKDGSDLSPRHLGTGWTPSTNSIFSLTGTTYHTPMGVSGSPDTPKGKREMEESEEERIKNHYSDTCIQSVINRSPGQTATSNQTTPGVLEANAGLQILLLSDQRQSKEYEQYNRIDSREQSQQISLRRTGSEMQIITSQSTSENTKTEVRRKGTPEDSRLQFKGIRWFRSQSEGFIQEQITTVDPLDIDSEISKCDPSITNRLNELLHQDKNHKTSSGDKSPIKMVNEDLQNSELSIQDDTCFEIAQYDERTESEGSRTQSTAISRPTEAQGQKTTYTDERTANLLNESFDNWAQQKPYTTVTASEYLTNSDSISAIQEMSRGEEYNGRHGSDFMETKGLDISTRDQSPNMGNQKVIEDCKTPISKVQIVQDSKENPEGFSDGPGPKEGTTTDLDDKFHSILTQSVTMHLGSPVPGSVSQDWTIGAYSEVRVSHEIDLSNIHPNKSSNITVDTETKLTQLTEEMSPNQRIGPFRWCEVKPRYHDLRPGKSQSFSPTGLDGAPKSEDHAQQNDTVQCEVVNIDQETTIAFIVDDRSPTNLALGVENQIPKNEEPFGTEEIARSALLGATSDQMKTIDCVLTAENSVLNDSLDQDQTKVERGKTCESRSVIQSNPATTELVKTSIPLETVCGFGSCEAQTTKPMYRASRELEMHQPVTLLREDEDSEIPVTEQMPKSTEVPELNRHDQQLLLEDTGRTSDATEADSLPFSGKSEKRMKSDSKDGDLLLPTQNETQAEISEPPLELTKSSRRSWRLSSSISQNLKNITMTEPHESHEEQTHTRTAVPERIYRGKSQTEMEEKTQDTPAARRRSITITDPHFSARDHLAESNCQRQILGQKVEPIVFTPVMKTVSGNLPAVTQEEGQPYQETSSTCPYLAKSYSTSSDVFSGQEQTDSSIRMTTSPECISHDFVSEMEDVTKSFIQDRLRTEISCTMIKADNRLVANDQSACYSEVDEPRIQTVIPSDENIKRQDRFSSPRSSDFDEIVEQVKEQFFMQNLELAVLFDTDHAESTAFWTTVPHPEPNTTEMVDPEAVQQPREQHFSTLSAEAPFRWLESASRHSVTFRCTPGTGASEVFTNTGLANALEDIKPRLSGHASNVETPRKDISSTEPRRECQIELRVTNTDGLENRPTPLQMDVRPEKIGDPKRCWTVDEDKTVVLSERPMQYKSLDGLRLNNRCDNAFRTPESTPTSNEPMCYFEQVSEHSEVEEKSTTPIPNRWSIPSLVVSNRKEAGAESTDYMRTANSLQPKLSGPQLDIHELVVTIKSSIEFRTQIPPPVNGRTSVTTNTTVYTRSPTPNTDNSQIIIPQMANRQGKTDSGPIRGAENAEVSQNLGRMVEEKTKDTDERREENAGASTKNVESVFTIKRDSFGRIHSDGALSFPNEISDPNEIQSPEPNCIVNMISPEAVMPCELNHDKIMITAELDEDHGRHGHLAWRESDISQLFERKDMSTGYDQRSLATDFSPPTYGSTRKFFHNEESLAISMLPQHGSMISQMSQTMSSSEKQTVFDVIEPLVRKKSADTVRLTKTTLQDAQEDSLDNKNQTFIPKINTENMIRLKQATIHLHSETSFHDRFTPEAVETREHIHAKAYSLGRTMATNTIDQLEYEIKVTPIVTTKQSMTMYASTFAKQPLEFPFGVGSLQLMDMIPNYKPSMESTASSYYTAQSSLTGLNRFGITSNDSDVLMPEIEYNEEAQKCLMPKLASVDEKMDEESNSQVNITKCETDDGLLQMFVPNSINSTEIKNRDRKSSQVEFASHIKTQIGRRISDVVEVKDLNFLKTSPSPELTITEGLPRETRNEIENVGESKGEANQLSKHLTDDKVNRTTESDIIPGQQTLTRPEKEIDTQITGPSEHTENRSLVITENRERRDGTEGETTRMIPPEWTDKPLETTEGFSQQLGLFTSHDTNELTEPSPSDFAALAGAYYRASLNKGFNTIDRCEEPRQTSGSPYVDVAERSEFKPQPEMSGSIETNRSARAQTNDKANDSTTASILDRAETVSPENPNLEVKVEQTQSNKQNTFVPGPTAAPLKTHYQSKIVYDGKNTSVMSMRLTNTARLGRSSSADRRRRQEWSSEVSIETPSRIGSSVSLPNLTETIGHQDISNVTTQCVYAAVPSRSCTMNIQAGLGHSSAGRPSSPFEWSLASTAFVPYSNATTSSESALPTSPTGHKLAQRSDTPNWRRPFGVKARHIVEVPANHNVGSFGYRKEQSNSNLPSPTGRTDHENSQSQSGSRSRISQVQITISQRVRRNRGLSKGGRTTELLALQGEPSSGLSPSTAPSDLRAVSPTEVSSNIERDPEQYTIAREITDQAIHKAIGRFCSSSPTMLSSANTEPERETDSSHDGEMVATVTADYDVHVSSSVDIRENARSPVTVTMGSAQENSLLVSPSTTALTNGSPEPCAQSPEDLNRPRSPGSLSIQADLHIITTPPPYGSSLFSTELSAHQEINLLTGNQVDTTWMSNVDVVGGSREAPCHVSTKFDIRVTARDLQTPSSLGELQNYDPRSQRLALPIASSPSSPQPVQSNTPEIPTALTRQTASGSPRVGDLGNYEDAIRIVEDQQCQLSSSIEVHTVTRTSLIVSSPALPRGHVTRSPTLSPIITTTDDQRPSDKAREGGESGLQQNIDAQMQKAPHLMIKTDAGDLSKAASFSPKQETGLSVDKSAAVDSPTSIPETNQPEDGPGAELFGSEEVNEEPAGQSEASKEDGVEEGQFSPSPEPTVDLPDIVSPMSGESLSYEHPAEEIQSPLAAYEQQLLVEQEPPLIEKRPNDVDEDKPAVIVDTTPALEIEEAGPALLPQDQMLVSEAQIVRIVSYATIKSEHVSLENESPEKTERADKPHIEMYTETFLETAEGKKIPLEASAQRIEIPSDGYVEQEDGTQTYKQEIITGPIEIGGRQIEIRQTIDVTRRSAEEPRALPKEEKGSEPVIDTAGVPSLVSAYVSDTDAVALRDVDIIETIDDTKTDRTISATSPTSIGQAQMSQPTTDIGQQEIKETPTASVEKIQPSEEAEKTQDKPVTPGPSLEVTKSETEKNVGEQEITIVPEPAEPVQSPDLEADTGIAASQRASSALSPTEETEVEVKASEQTKAEALDDRRGRTSSMKSETSVQIPGKSEISETQPPASATEIPAEVGEQVPQVVETAEKQGEKDIEIPEEQPIQMTPTTDEPAAQTAGELAAPEVSVSISEQEVMKQQDVVDKAEPLDRVQEEKIPPTSPLESEVATIQDQETPVIKIGEQTRVAISEAAEDPNLSKRSSQAEGKTVSPQPDNEVQAESLVGEIGQQERKESQENVENIASMDDNLSKRLASTEQMPDTLAGAETIPITETPGEGGRPITSDEEKEENTVVTKVDIDGEVEQPIQQYQETQSDRISDPARVGDDAISPEEEITVQPPIPQTLSETAMLEDTMVPVDVEPIPTDQPREQIVEPSQMETQPSSIRETDYQEQVGESKLASEAMEEKSITEFTEAEKTKITEQMPAEFEELQLPETKEQEAEENVGEVTEIRPELPDEQAVIAKQTEEPFSQPIKMTLPIEIREPPDNMQRTEGKSVITEVTTEIEINLRPGEPPEISVKTVTGAISEQAGRQYDMLSPDESVQQQMLASGGVTDINAETTTIVEGVAPSLIVGDRDEVREEPREVHKLDTIETEEGNQEQHQEGITVGATVETELEDGNIGTGLNPALVAEGKVDSTNRGMIAGLRDVDVCDPTSTEADERVAQTEALKLIETGQRTLTTPGLEVEPLEQQIEESPITDQPEEQKQLRLATSSESDINVIGFAIQKFQSTDDLLLISVSGRELLVKAAKDLLSDDEAELTDELRRKLEEIVELNEQINQMPEFDRVEELDAASTALSGVQSPKSDAFLAPDMLDQQGQSETEAGVKPIDSILDGVAPDSAVDQTEEQEQLRLTTSSESDINVIGFAIQKFQSTDDLLLISVSGRELLVKAAKDLLSDDEAELTDGLRKKLEEIVGLNEQINQMPEQNVTLEPTVAERFDINMRPGGAVFEPSLASKRTYNICSPEASKMEWKPETVSEVDMRFSKNAETTSMFTVKADVKPIGEVPTTYGISRELSEPTTSLSERRIGPSRHSRGIRTREDSDSLDRHFNALMYGRARQTVESSECPKGESKYYQTYTARRMHRVEKVVNALDDLILETIQYIKQNLPPRE